MDKELKAKWVAALRSEKYQQCKGKLFDGQGYCCYGVLRAIANPGDERSVRGVCLTREQLAEYGFEYGFERAVLENMNDGMDANGSANKGKQYNFAEIADYIEANL